MRVLVVDDDQLLVKQLQRYLERHKHEAHCANSGEQALELLERLAAEERLPHAIFTDIRMGVMSGLDLITRVQERWKQTLIIVMTGYGTIENAIHAMRRGAFDFITKPFRTPLIGEKLKDLEAEMSLRRELLEARPVEGEPSPRLTDPRTWLEARAGDTSLLVVSPRERGRFLGPDTPDNLHYLQLTPDSQPGNIPPGHLHSLLKRLSEFSHDNPGGLVYLEGLGLLTRMHGFATVQNLLTRYMTEHKETKCHLCLGVRPGELEPAELDSLQQTLAQEQLVNISRSMAHEARLAILYHVGQTRGVAFNELFKAMNLASSASLTFHLKQLLQTNLLEQTGEGAYRLTPEGHTSLEALSRLRELSATSFTGPATLLTLAGTDTEADPGTDIEKSAGKGPERGPGTDPD